MAPLIDREMQKPSLRHKLTMALARPGAALHHLMALLLYPISHWVVKGDFWARRRDVALSRWFQINRRTFFDKFFYKYCLRIWIDEVYLAEPDPDAREHLKAKCMGGDSGVAWAEHYDAQLFDPYGEIVGDLTMADATPVFGVLEKSCSKVPNKGLVIQIGSSSGREIAYFAQRFRNLTFIGLDIDQQITERAATAHSAPNLVFRTGLAHKLDLILGEFEAGLPLIVFAHGSFNYVQPEHLLETFQYLCARGNVELISTESARFSPFHDDPSPDHLAGTRYRGNFSYTHDYRWYAEKVGFNTIDCRLIRAYKNPADVNHYTLNYHYHGRT